MTPDTGTTRLARVIRPLAQAHPGKSGVVPLADGHDAFAARALLADAAERTLDVQYYIWHKDLSGTLLLGALHRAAERGVRVRLLLDDNNTRGLDVLLAALAAHPNIEVRLFNPFKLRRWRALNFLTDFGRLNRRMHNKSFTADNRIIDIPEFPRRRLINDFEIRYGGFAPRAPIDDIFAAIDQPFLI